MKRRVVTFSILLFFAIQVYSQFVSVSGNKFQVEGKDIFFNGINAPWQYRNDCDINFMRRDFDWNWWNSEFQKYANNKINLVRIWIHGSGNYSPAIKSDSYVTGYSDNDQFWTDMDALVSLAASYEIYIMPTFWSFDMVKEGMSSYFQRYRTLVQDDNRIGSYLDNFLVPFVQRYNNNPWVMGYDLCNEPEHMWRDANCGNINQYWVMRFFARCASAIHQNSSKPVTIGSMWIIYNSPLFGSPDGDLQAGRNRYTDASLKTYYDNPNAYIDFYSPHWYAWQNTSGPYEKTVNNWIGSNDKPVIIGETFGGNNYNIYGSMGDYYINSYNNGFDGVIAWKNACENDGYGTFDGVAQGTNAFYNAYPNLVYPNLQGQDNENIAYAKPSFTSSSESSSYSSNLAFDGDGNTRWASSWDDQQWIYVDLQSQYNITRVRLDWETAYARQFQIQVSSDNVNWTTVYSNYNATGGETDIQIASVGRYVKMYAWQRASSWGYSLWEFEVYGTQAELKSAKEGLLENNFGLSSNLKLYPVPATGRVTISGLSGVSLIKVDNVLGMYSNTFNVSGEEDKFTFDVSAWPKGLYLVQVKNEVLKLMIN